MQQKTYYHEHIQLFSRVSEMEDLTLFSFRIPKALAARTEAAAKRLGVSKSEYARRAMEEFNHRVMQERMAELSQRLAKHSAAAALSMEGSSTDGLA
jgi:predicted DNA-binding protein